MNEFEYDLIENELDAEDEKSKQIMEVLKSVAL